MRYLLLPCLVVEPPVHSLVLYCAVAVTGPVAGSGARGALTSVDTAVMCRTKKSGTVAVGISASGSSLPQVDYRLPGSRSREEIPERLPDLGAYRRPGDDHADHGHRRVGVPASPDEAGRYPGGLQGARVGNALVTQRVEVRRDDAGWGQTFQVAAQWGGAGVAAVGRIGVVIPEPPHQRGGEDVPVAVFGVGRPGHVRVHDRAYQQLPRDVRAFGVAGQLARDGGDVGPRAPAGDGELTGDAAQLDGIGARPLHGREGVQRGGGKANLRSVAVIHRHDHRARA